MNARTAILLVALPLACACAARGPGGGTAPARDPYRITAAELATVQSLNLYDAIRQLRPMWFNPAAPLNARGGALARRPVYLDRTPYGDLDALRSLSLADVMEVRLLTPEQAMGEFQRDDMLGAIQVITKPRT